MATKTLIKKMIEKYSTKQYVTKTRERIYPKIEWTLWGNDAPAATQPGGFRFNFDGKFLKSLTPTEAKVLALHEIAHYNTLLGQGASFQHGDPMHELAFYGLFQKEGISYSKVNSTLRSIAKKWKDTKMG